MLNLSLRDEFLGAHMPQTAIRGLTLLEVAVPFIEFEAL